MKNKKTWILWVIAAVLIVAVAVFFVVKYKDEIFAFLTDTRDKLCDKVNKMISKDEFEDYADVEM